MLERSLAFNLEPTFRCNLTCEMCPRFSSQDPYLDMESSTFQRICDAMHYAHTADFTGWGEPLLHPAIFDMVAEAKSRGCVTSMTSNGTALNPRNARSLLEAGLDRLAVSVDGIRAETYDKIRSGSDFGKISRNLLELSDLIRRTGSSLELSIAYTVQEMNADELSLLVPWVSSIGARLIHLKQLNAVSNAGDWERSLLKYRLAPRKLDCERLSVVETAIAGVLEQAERAGLRVLMHSEYPLTSDLRGRHCLATPLHAVYFSYEGRVSPCCHLGHVVSRYFEGRSIPPSALYVGDIRVQTFEEIWQSPEYRDFRDGFAKELFPSACRDCYLLYGK